MKVTDVVCGMSFPEEKAATQFQHLGVTYYFCSNACRKQFEENPGAYLADGKAEA